MGRSYETCPLMRKKWHWKRDVVQQHSFWITHDEPTAILAVTLRLFKNYTLFYLHGQGY